VARKFTCQFRKSKIFWLAGLVVILAAFFFRFYRLADYPPGIFFDPAINGLDAIRLMQRGGPVIFFPTNGGREALFIYLLIPFIWFFGATPLAMRLLTAMISLFSVVFLFGWLSDACLRAKFTSEQTAHNGESPLKVRSQGNQLWLATLAGLVLATSYWHIAISRLGQRPILVPMLAIPIFWFFLKAWASGKKRWFALAGSLMGLAGHTYPAARLLPIILVLALLPEFWPGLHRRSKTLNYRQTLANLAIFGGVALIIYMPMGWYLLNHPAQFTTRASSVMLWNFLDTPADIMAEIGRNIWRVARFSCCEGSPNPIFGWPGYPGVSPLLSPFLLLGLLIALKAWRTLFYRLLVIWWFVGLAPSIIAIEAPHPLRMIVAVPPTAILIALGLLYSFNWLQPHLIKDHELNNFPNCSRRIARMSHSTSAGLWPGFGNSGRAKWVCYLILIPKYVLRFTFYALPLILIFLHTPSLFRAYFKDWTQLKTTQGVYDYGAIAIRDAVLAQAGQPVPIYLPWSRFNDSTLLFYLSGHFQREARFSVAPAEAALVITPDKDSQAATWIRLSQEQATILPPLTRQGQQLIQTALAGGQATSIHTATGQTAARQLLLSDDPARYVEAPAHGLNVSYGPIRLVGATYPKIIEPAAEFPVTLFWQAQAQMRDEYEVLVRLVDDNRQARSNGDARPTDWVYPTTFWRPNLDKIAAQHRISPPALPLQPGRYWLAVSIFDPALGQRLPLTGGASASPDTFFIGPLKVPLPPPAAPITPSGQPVSFGQVAELVGFELDRQTVAPGEAIQLSLLWQAKISPQVDYTVFVHLIGPDDHLVAGNDTQPLGGRYPTTIWSTGERILDRHTLTIPAELPPGSYQLAIGLYQHASGERLPLVASDGHQDTQGRLILGQKIMIVRRQ
jgi:hypothetical protein